MKSLKIVYSGDHRFHDPPFEIYDGIKEPYAEKKERLSSIKEALIKNRIGEFVKPLIFSLDHINKIHQKEYVAFLKKRSESLKKTEILYPSYFIQDTYTPIVSHTFKAAKSAVDVALTGSSYVLSSEKTVYALCRPPGHHAEYKAMSGYCYFNNAAIAANYLSKKGKVTILDIDFHHGNGTQNLFYERSDVLYVSIHADPHEKFPYNSGFEEEKGSGDGIGFNKNYPLPLGTTDVEYGEILKKALIDISSFQPKFLVISAGFDTYEKDPIGGFKLTVPFYERIGSEIAKLKLPTLIVQEGGYYIEDLGKIAVSFLKAFQTKK